MQQIYNITQVRNNISALVSRIAKEKKSMIIVRDSMPEAVLVPYEDYIKQEEEKEYLWQARFDKLLTDGKKLFRKWTRDKKIPFNKLTEDKVYDLIDRV